MDVSWYWWALFFAIVAALLAADLGLFQRKAHEVKLGEALQATALRVALALGFNALIYFGLVGGYHTPDAQHKAGIEFLTCYLVEIALSVDNVFVFAVLFKYFSVPPQYQHRVLFWGILGALVMRAILIFAGIALINKFHWVIYIFALILIYGGIKMMNHDSAELDPSTNPLIKLFRRFVPVTPDFEGPHFFTKRNGLLMATPLCVVLVAIETTDLLFAVDSIPAVLAVTVDPFIVFTSNVFAILGLRALYFALAGVLKLFRFLHYGLSAILIFIGVKMLLSATPWAIRTEQSLAVVIVLLFASIIASLVIREKKLDSVQQAARDQFDKQSGNYGKTHILANTQDVEKALGKVDLNEGEPALDIATGGGHTALFLAGKGMKVTASDIAPKMLENTSQLASEHGLQIHTALHEAEKLPYPDASFSLVTCRVAAHHFSNAESFLKESARVLKPGGHFLLIDGSVPDDEPAAEAWIHQIEKLRDPSHGRFLTPSKWRRLCEAAGLQVVHAELEPLKQPDLEWYFQAANTPEENRVKVRELVKLAPPDALRVFKIAEEDGKVTWTWPILSLLARKA